MLELGLSNYGSGPTEQESMLAELFLHCVPTAEKVQFLNSGSEATAQAIRVARAQTGRDHVILIQGSYNGNQNVVAANLMDSAQQLGSRPAIGREYPLNPITAGIPASEAALLHAVEFNDLEAVENVAGRYPIAALITEPVLQNVGVVKPENGYLAGLRQLADRHGFLLIFDEVKTGFRAALGGYQSICGVTPDREQAPPARSKFSCRSPTTYVPRQSSTRGIPTWRHAISCSRRPEVEFPRKCRW